MPMALGMGLFVFEMYVLAICTQVYVHNSSILTIMSFSTVAF